MVSLANSSTSTICGSSYLRHPSDGAICLGSAAALPSHPGFLLHLPSGASRNSALTTAKMRMLHFPLSAVTSAGGSIPCVIGGKLT